MKVLIKTLLGTCLIALILGLLGVSLMYTSIVLNIFLATVTVFWVLWVGYLLGDWLLRSDTDKDEDR